MLISKTITKGDKEKNEQKRKRRNVNENPYQCNQKYPIELQEVHSPAATTPSSAATARERRRCCCCCNAATRRKRWSKLPGPPQKHQRNFLNAQHAWTRPPSLRLHNNAPKNNQMTPQNTQVQAPGASFFYRRRRRRRAPAETGYLFHSPGINSRGARSTDWATVPIIPVDDSTRSRL